MGADGKSIVLSKGEKMFEGVFSPRHVKKLYNADYCELCERIMPDVDTHHLLYQRRNYKQGTFRNARNLPCQIVVICRTTHCDIHHANPNPPRMSHNKAAQLIANHKQGHCRCYNHHKLTLNDLLPSHMVRQL